MYKQHTAVENKKGAAFSSSFAPFIPPFNLSIITPCGGIRIFYNAATGILFTP